MKVRKGKGVLCKDGVTPWAAGSLQYVQTTETGTWRSPADYTMSNMALLIAALHEGKIDAVELIDLNNDKFVYELKAAEKRALNRP